MSETGLQNPGNFKVEEANLITSAGIDIPLMPHLVSINLYEDILKNAISGEILLQEAADLVGKGPIIGQEYLLLKISTPSFQSEGDIIDFTKNVFVINSMENRISVGNNVNMYLLSFTTSELVKNQRTKINKVLSGTYSDIVENMLKTLDCQKQIFIEPTSGVKRIVAPNVTPFSVIGMALKDSTSTFAENLSPSYMFYETLKGYNFRTLSSMYSQPVSQTYTTFIAGGLGGDATSIGKNPQGVINIESALASILEYEIVENSDSLYNYTTGVYGSKLIVHNIYNKTFSEHTYNIFDNFDKENHITSYHDKNQFPIFSAVSIEKDGSRVSDFPAKTYLASISEYETDTNNTTIKGVEPFAAPSPQNSLQERASTLNQLDKGLLINIVTHGNTSINAGDVVIIDLPKQQAYDDPEDSDGKDRFYQGVFLVKKIKHEFAFYREGNKHVSRLTLVKDSLAKSLDGPKNLYEPKPEKEPLVYKDKETFYPMLTGSGYGG